MSNKRFTYIHGKDDNADFFRVVISPRFSFCLFHLNLGVGLTDCACCFNQHNYYYQYIIGEFFS